MNKDKNKEMLIPYAPTGIDEKIYIAKSGKEAIKKASLGDAIIELDKVITENYTPQEMKMYNENMQLRLKLADLEDEILYRYSPDWFRCEGCNTVTHGDNLSVHYCNSDTKICANCAPEEN